MFEAATGMAAILAGTSTITTLVGEIFTMITSNPLLVVFVAASLLGVAIKVFGQLRGSSKGG